VWWGQQRWQVSQHLALLTIMSCSNLTSSCCSGAGGVVQITGKGADNADPALLPLQCWCGLVFD
jgi:hypothetical protein